MIIILFVISIIIILLLYRYSARSVKATVVAKNNTNDNRTVAFVEQTDSDRCLLASDCQGICHWGHCLPLPKTEEETMAAKYTGGGAVTLTNHLFKIDNKGSRMPKGGWILSDSVQIIDGFQNNSYFILTESGIYYQDASIIKICGPKIDDHEIERIFIMKSAIYALCNFRIYRGFSLSQFRHQLRYPDSREWEWEKVDFLAGKDIADLRFYDSDTALNGDVYLAEKNGTYYCYHNNYWTTGDIATYKFTLSNGSYSLEDDEIPSRIRLGAHYEHRLAFYGSRIELINNNRVIYEINDVWDAVIDPVSGSSVYVMTTDGQLRHYQFVDKDGMDYSFDAHNNIDRYSLEWQPLEGRGKRLIRTKHGVWLITHIETIS